MRKRQRMTRKASRKSFKRGAVRTNHRNTRSAPMRGGIRF